MSVDDLPTTTPVPASAPPAKMSPIAKAGIALVVLTMLVLGAWFYGRSSTAPDRAATDATRLRMMLLEARAQVLDAQISLYSTNFGSAAQHLEYAKPPLTAASGELRRQGRDDLAIQADGALERVTAARDLAAKLSLDANSRAGEASKLLGEVLSALPR
jgi:hypothetical protein